MAKRIVSRRPQSNLGLLRYKTDASNPPDIGDSEFHAESLPPRRWPSDFS